MRSYIERGHHETAVFWADKILTLSAGDPKDVYWMAFALYQVSAAQKAKRMGKMKKCTSIFLISILVS